jgi:hypothetical protein
VVLVPFLDLLGLQLQSPAIAPEAIRIASTPPSVEGNGVSRREEDTCVCIRSPIAGVAAVPSTSDQPSVPERIRAHGVALVHPLAMRVFAPQANLYAGVRDSQVLRGQMGLCMCLQALNNIFAIAV